VATGLYGGKSNKCQQHCSLRPRGCRRVIEVRGHFRAPAFTVGGWSDLTVGVFTRLGDVGGAVRASNLGNRPDAKEKPFAGKQH